MAPTEKKTLLKMIAILAEMAGFDLRESGFTKYSIANEIAREGGLRSAALTPETVSKKLAAAREEIRPQGPTAPQTSRTT